MVNDGDVIQLSSDDEKNDNKKTVPNQQKKRKLQEPNKSKKRVKTITNKNDDDEIEVVEVIQGIPIVKKKVNNEVEEKLIKIENENTEEKEKNNDKKHHKEDKDKNTEENINNDTIDEAKDDESSKKPCLIVKDIRPAEKINQDVFSMLISLCLQKGDAKMTKIVDRLKRNYEKMDQTYAQSQSFIEFLNKKRELIKNGPFVYRHLEEILQEMKSKTKNLFTPGTSNISNLQLELTNERFDKLIKLEKLMLKIQKRIVKFENTEVDFDDEENSTYMMVEKYKSRMIKIYNAYCKLTGLQKEADRSYLKPKHFKLTDIDCIDEAINKFVNSNLSERRKYLQNMSRKYLCSIFPDYCDVLKIVQKENEKNNLKFNDTKCEDLAREAFKKLGNKLQQERVEDYRDSLNCIAEGIDEDPASKNPNLLLKLDQNKKEFTNKLNQVFEEFSIKQNNSDTVVENENSDKEDEEDEEDEEESDSESTNELNSDKLEEELNSDFDSDVEKKTNENELKENKDENVIIKETEKKIEKEKTPGNEKKNSEEKEIVKNQQMKKSREEKEIDVETKDDKKKENNEKNEIDIVMKEDERKKNIEEKEIDIEMKENEKNEDVEDKEIDIEMKKDEKKVHKDEKEINTKIEEKKVQAIEIKNHSSSPKINKSTAEYAIKSIKEKITDQNQTLSDTDKSEKENDEVTSSNIASTSKTREGMKDLVVEKESTSVKPMLKLKPFAKQPQHWTSSDIGKKSPIKVVDLIDDEKDDICSQKSPHKEIFKNHSTTISLSAQKNEISKNIKNNFTKNNVKANGNSNPTDISIKFDK